MLIDQQELSMDNEGEVADRLWEEFLAVNGNAPKGDNPAD